MSRPLIVITNDDGIKSPGLAAAAAALDELGDLLIVAPASQQTSMGRSRTHMYDLNGKIDPCPVHYRDKTWGGFSVNTTPALAVDYALLELASRPADLVVSGINYGENVGTCITVSGTVGAALEAAERGVRAMAVSLETPVAQYYDHDESVDFSTAMHFVNFFASRLLSKTWPADVDVLKVDIPTVATPLSDWMVTRQDKYSYYFPQLTRRAELFVNPGNLELRVIKGNYGQKDTDAHALALGCVSVTPLSLDNTSRVSLADLKGLIG